MAGAPATYRRPWRGPPLPARLHQARPQRHDQDGGREQGSSAPAGDPTHRLRAGPRSPGHRGDPPRRRPRRDRDQPGRGRGTAGDGGGDHAEHGGGRTAGREQVRRQRHQAERRFATARPPRGGHQRRGRYGEAPPTDAASCPPAARPPTAPAGAGRPSPPRTGQAVGPGQPRIDHQQAAPPPPGPVLLHLSGRTPGRAPPRRPSQRRAARWLRSGQDDEPATVAAISQSLTRRPVPSALARVATVPVSTVRLAPLTAGQVDSSRRPHGIPERTASARSSPTDEGGQQSRSIGAGPPAAVRNPARSRRPRATAGRRAAATVAAPPRPGRRPPDRRAVPRQRPTA